MDDPTRDHCGRNLTALWLCAPYRRSLHLSCQECPHHRLFDAIPVWRLFKRRGWPEALQDVPRRFHCSRCRRGYCSKVVRPLVRVSMDQAPPCELPYPDEREWKRMVSRHQG